MTRPPSGLCASCSPLVKCDVVDGKAVCGPCPEGTTGDGKDCEDVDECALGIDECDHDPPAVCRNSPRSYQCFCPSGTIDANPSTPGRECTLMPAPGFGGSGGAAGLGGFGGSMSGAGGTGGASGTGGTGGASGTGGGSGTGGTAGSGQPVDECALDSDTCDDQPDACHDTAAGFSCVCPTGYSDVNGDGSECTDIDECALGTDLCDDSPVAACTNSVGSYSCACPSGYADPTGRNCQNVNECSLGTDTCDDSPAATCMDTAGSYTCTCPAGYSDPTGRNCVNVDECALGTDLCDDSPAASCADTVGSYTCTCPQGYSDPQGRNCLNVDECALDLDDCDDDPNACVDAPGSYGCQCPVGYDDVNGDGSACQNIDECALGLDECDDSPVAACADTPGSYACQCPEGYGDSLTGGRNCVNVDECALDSDDCDDSPDACIDMNPSFACVCPLGYTDTMGDGSACAPIITPLDEADGTPYLGLYSLGLYPAGNQMPPEHRAAGIALANQVQPLDQAGNPSPSGRIGLLSIGMSNPQEEFCCPYGDTPPRMDPQDPTRVQCDTTTFMSRARNPNERINRTSLVIVNGAFPGQIAANWETETGGAGATFPPVPPNPAFPTAVGNYARIRDHVLPVYTEQISEAQIQVAWVKLSNGAATVGLPDPSADAFQLETSLGRVMRLMKQHYPNLKLVFLTSRTYAGYAAPNATGVEPYAYEGGFSVKWLIEAQIQQMATGAVTDSRAGDLDYDAGTAAWLAWGPYLWADEMSRSSDGLNWCRADFVDIEGVHPSAAGKSKISLMLMYFFETSPFTSCWFMEAGVCQ